MPVVLSAPPWSFIQIQEPERGTGCVDEFNTCLPALGTGDLTFQLLASVSGADKDWFEVQFDYLGHTSKFTVFGKLCVDCEDIVPPYGDLSRLFPWKASWRKIEEGTTDIWVGNFTSNGTDETFQDLPSGSCFNLCFHKVQININDETQTEGLSAAKIACTSTCFQKIDEDCFTSLLTYQSYEDSMDFIYTNVSKVVNFSNQVRLPCYLRDIQFETEQKTYQKSNGDSIKLFARIAEDYELVVDWIPKGWHKRLVILLQHDYVSIDNTNDGPAKQMRIVCEDKYEIQWPDEPYELATAKTRVKRATGINLMNSNCA